MFTSPEMMLSSYFRIQKRNNLTGVISNIAAADPVCGLDFLAFTVRFSPSRVAMMIRMFTFSDVLRLSFFRARQNRALVDGQLPSLRAAGSGVSFG